MINLKEISVCLKKHNDIKNYIKNYELIEIDHLTILIKKFYQIFLNNLKQYFRFFKKLIIFFLKNLSSEKLCLLFDIFKLSIFLLIFILTMKSHIFLHASHSKFSDPKEEYFSFHLLSVKSLFPLSQIHNPNSIYLLNFLR